MPIHFIKEKQRFVIETDRSAYCFDVGEHGHVMSVYWGKRLSCLEDYHCLQAIVIPHSSFEATRGVMGYEYIPWGEMVYSEPTLKVQLPNGDRGLKLTFLDYHIQDDKLTITFTDQLKVMTIKLIYQVYEKHDVIARKQKLKNTNDKDVTIDAIRSFQLSLPWGQDYRLTHLAGRWSGEFQLVQETIHEGRKTLDSRRGQTSHQASPWLAMDHDATEDHGEVWYAHLAYSGSWEITIEKDTLGFVQVAGGIQSFDFEWRLQPGEIFETPEAYLGFSDEGFGGMSRKSDQFQRSVLLPVTHRGRPRQVLYNSWEATYFDVTEAGQKALAKKAAALGVELFVVDDGWFGERNSDRVGLGDWVVNQDKFPHGLTPLIDEVRSHGMDFGIWLEPEMVNPDSDLYRSQPDWIYRFQSYEPTTARHQFVLNLGIQEVVEYLINKIDDLLSRHTIRFVKWDMNRAFSEPGWADVESRRQKELWFRHVKGLYSIFDTLRQRHPEVVFESCSGGGGRIDLGIMQRADQFWTSDNTDALDRLYIQDGYSYAYNAKSMMCWVTDSPNWLNKRELPLSFRFHVAMMGSLGLGGNLNKWSDQELNEAADFVSEYKTIRPIIQDGERYRLKSLTDHQGKEAAYQYISKDKTDVIVFAFSIQQKYGDRAIKIKLKGLDPHATYTCRTLDLTASGQYFTEYGFVWLIENDIDSTLFKFKQVVGD